MYFIKTHNSQPGHTNPIKQPRKDHETFLGQRRQGERQPTDHSFSEGTSEEPQPVRLISFLITLQVS